MGKKILKGIFATLAWTLIGAFSLVLSVVVHVRVNATREFVRTLAQDLVRENVRGRLSIGTIDVLNGRRVVIRDVRIFDPQGREVIRAARVEAWLNLGALANGVINVTRATIDGAHVVLVRGEEDLPTLLEAFEPLEPSTGPASATPHVLIEHVYLRAATVEGEVPSISGIRARDLNVDARFELQSELKLSIYDADAMITAPYRPNVDVRKVQGVIDTNPARGIDLYVAAESGATDHIRARVHVLPATEDPSSKTRVDILANLDPLSVQTLRGADVPGLEKVRGTVRGHVRLEGPVDELRFAGQLAHEAGNVRVEGRLSDTEGLDVRAVTNGVYLDRAIEGVPENLRIGGDARLHLSSLDTENETPPTFHAEINAFMFDEWAIPSFTTDGAIEPNAIRIDRVDAPYARGEVHGSGTISTGEDGNIELDVRARIPQIANDPNVHRLMPEARAALDASVHIRTAEPDVGQRRVEVRGSVSLRNASLNSIEATSIQARGQLRIAGRTPSVNGNVHATGVRIADYELGDGTIAVRGGPNTYTTSGRFEAPGKRRADFDATITARRDGAIEIDAPSVQLSIGELVWRGIVQDLVVLPDRYIETTLVRLANGSQRLEARGRVAFRSSQNFDITLQDFDLSVVNRFLGRDSMRLIGRVDAHAIMQGTLQEPTLSLEGALREACVDRVDGINAVYRMSYANGAIEIDQQIDFGERGNLMLSGTGEIPTTLSNPVEALRAGNYNLTFDIGDLSLAVAENYLPERFQGMSGSLAGHAELMGTIERPTLRVDMAFTAHEMFDMPVFVVAMEGTYDATTLAATIALRQDDDVLATSDIRYEANAMELVDGTTTLSTALSTRVWSVTFDVPNTSTEDLSATLRALLRDYPFEGSLAFAAHGGPSGFGAELRSRVVWHDDLSALPCGQGAEPRLWLEARVDRGHLEALATGFLKANQTAFEMRASTDVDVDSWLRDMRVPEALPATTIDVNIPELDLGQVPIVCNRVTGPLRGTINATQIFTDAHALHAVLNAENLRVNNGPATNLEVVANASTRALVADLALGSPVADSRAEVQATMQVEWETRMPFPVVHADGRFLLLAQFQNAQVAPLLALVPGIADAQMVLDGSLQAQGTREELTWDGELTIDRGSIELMGPGQRLVNVVGLLHFMADHAVIDRLHAEDVDGSVDLTGEIAFNGLIPETAELNVNLVEFPVRRDGLVLANLSGQAHLRASVTRQQTDIQVGVQNLAVRLPDESDQAIQSLELNPDIVVVGEEREDVDPSHAYPFHVNIDADQPFWVRRSDFAAQVRARLDVLYRDPELRVGGYVNLTRGFFEIFGKRFNLARGSMTFDNAAELNPNLDIVAIYTLPGGQARTVTVTVSGRLSSPQIDFSTSEATTDRGEIIALLLSGRTSISQGASSGTNTEDARQQAASFVSGVLAGVLTLGLRRQLGDLFPVISIESGDTAFRSARVRVGFQADSFIRDKLPWLSSFVQGVYFEGFAAFSSTEASNTTLTSSQGSSPAGALLELHFPHSFVFTGTVRYPGSWGADVTWEP